VETSVAPADTTRRQLLALALPATAVLLLIGESLTPAGLDQTPMSAASALPLLPKAAAHVNQLYFSNALVLLGLGTLLISYLALTQLARLRGATLATVAAAIGSGRSLTVSSVITPNVPSVPTNPATRS